MNLSTAKTVRILLIAGVVLAIANVVLAVRYASLLREVRLASDDSIETERLAQRVEMLSAEVPAEQAAPEEPRELISRLRAGLAEVGIPESSVIDIRPGSQIAVPKTEFTREDTSLTLNQVEPAAVLRFIENAEAQAVGILCSGLVISPTAKAPLPNAGNSSASETTWNVQMTLTHIRRGGKSLRRMGPSGTQAVITTGVEAEYALDLRRRSATLHGFQVYHRADANKPRFGLREWMP